MSNHLCRGATDLPRLGDRTRSFSLIAQEFKPDPGDYPREFWRNQLRSAGDWLCRFRIPASLPASSPRWRTFPLAVLLTFVFWGQAKNLFGDAAVDPASVEQKKAALSKLNALMGQWRGVGQPQRNSSRGAWTEASRWVWAFEEGGPSIRYRVEKGKLFSHGELFWDELRKCYRFEAQFADETKRTYTGPFVNRKLTLTSQPDSSGDVHRIVIRMLQPKRTVVLVTKQRKGKGSFGRVAEIGYTRRGTSLAKSRSGGPECVVTGGLGTIPVMYKQQQYHVCCEGCLQVFEEDPAGTVAEHLARKAKPSEAVRQED